MHHDWLSYSREGNVLRAPPWENFNILNFYKRIFCCHLVKPYVLHRLENPHRFTPTANKVCGLYPFSPERETCCILPVNQLFSFLPFNKGEEVQHIIVIPSDSHSGINYPPTASKDRAVHSMEIKDFLILWTYSQ